MPVDPSKLARKANIDSSIENDGLFFTGPGPFLQGVQGAVLVVASRHSRRTRPPRDISPRGSPSRSWPRRAVQAVQRTLRMQDTGRCVELRVELRGELHPPCPLPPAVSTPEKWGPRTPVKYSRSTWPPPRTLYQSLTGSILMPLLPSRQRAASKQGPLR